MTRKTISKADKAKTVATIEEVSPTASDVNLSEPTLTAPIVEMTDPIAIDPVVITQVAPAEEQPPIPEFDPADLVGKPPKSVEESFLELKPDQPIAPTPVAVAPAVAPIVQNRYDRPDLRPVSTRSGGRMDSRTGSRVGGRMDSRTSSRNGGWTDNRSGNRNGGWTDNRMGGMNNMNRMPERQMNDDYAYETNDADGTTEVISGILDTSKDGHGVLREGFGDSDRDAYIATSQIRRFRLLPGDVVSGPARKPKENERYWGLLQVDKINDMTPEEFMKKGRTTFKSLTPVYPNEQIKLEVGKDPLSLRIIDMVAPIGKGQRGLIVSPPKAGKTTMLKDIAMGVARNNPEVHLMAVLVGERPEEVTDIRRHIAAITNGKGEVAASNFDELATDQCRTAELALERAKRLVEMGQDVFILLDSITRLARAYNLAMPTSGRTLSGGFDPAALFPPKKFFGAARNFETPGSLTIIGTALVDTGSRMDDLVYEEFKGTGNQEVHLDRHLAERRIWPSIDVQKSGTRRDDLLVDSVTYQSIITLQRMLDMLNKEERTMTLIERMKRSNSNKDFLASLKEG